MIRILFVALSAFVALQQPPRSYPLQRFEVIRTNPDDIRRLPESVRAIFVDPVPDGEPADSLEEAAKRVGFAPRMLKSPAVVQLYVTDPVNEDAKISATELATVLAEAKISNVVVPPSWNGVIVTLKQSPGVLADYGDFLIAQAGPMTLNAPSTFPLPEFLEVLFRVLGLSSPDAANLRAKFVASPSAFFPIPKRYDMDIRQVQLAGGTGLLLQNADKGGELALIWCTADRSYFLTGLLTEAQAIATANSLQ